MRTLTESETCTLENALHTAAADYALQAIAPDLLRYVRERAAIDEAALELARQYDRQVERFMADD
jgi:hypothetical protein